MLAAEYSIKSFPQSRKMDKKFFEGIYFALYFMCHEIFPKYIKFLQQALVLATI